MSFQSFHFLILFLLTFLFVRLVSFERQSFKKTFLLFVSYYFYMCWDWRFSGLILFVTVINFYVGPKIAKENRTKYKKLWLWASLTPSLLVLVYFKYVNFFIESFDNLLTTFGFSINLPLLNVILPVGISFYTFQSISYTLDIYRGRTDPVDNFRDFALFVAFFPQLVAGPIVRASHFLPQLKGQVKEEDNSVETGFALILRGFVKKIIFADVLGLHIVDPAFANPSQYSPIFLIIALYAYSYQVYMDFSGYTDIARGVSRTLGYDLQINFNRPYKAASISEFWQRWHISMSSFFRDYLYHGLGGSKCGNVYINLMITFVAIGVWHGAGWNFVVYGVCHGTMVGMERLFRERRKSLGLPEKKLSKTNKILYVFFIFNVISLTRVLFRGISEGASQYMNALIDMKMLENIPFDSVGYGILLIAIIAHYVPDQWTFDWKIVYAKLPFFVQAALIVLVIYLVSIRKPISC